MGELTRMVPQIDFLPATYHVQRQREHKTLWRRMMVFFFLTIAVLGTWMQRDLRRKLEVRRDELQAIAAGLMQSLNSESKADQRLNELETRSLLLTTLEMRVPMTRVLSAITNSLPDYVSLDDCQAEFGLKESTNVRSPPPPTSVVVDKANNLSPSELDLKELRNASNLSTMMLTLNGIAPDDLAISRYLVALRDTELFERVILSFSGQQSVRDEMWRKFEVRLQVKAPEALLDRKPMDRRLSNVSRSLETKGMSR